MNRYVLREEVSGDGADAGGTAPTQVNGMKLPEGFTPPPEMEGMEKFYSVSDDGEGNAVFDWQATALKTVTSYKDLQSKLGERETEMRGRLEDEVRSQFHGEAPESLDAYKVETPDLDTAELPDGYEIHEPEGPLTDAWKNFCFENKLGQKVFQGGINMMTKVQASMLPSLSEVAKEIGENAQGRMQTLSERVTAAFGEEANEGLSQLYRTDPGTFKALETLMESHILATEGGGASTESALTTGLSVEDLDEEINRLMQLPGYRNGDEAINNKVGKLISELHVRKSRSRG